MNEVFTGCPPEDSNCCWMEILSLFVCTLLFTLYSLCYCISASHAASIVASHSERVRSTQQLSLCSRTKQNVKSSKNDVQWWGGEAVAPAPVLHWPDPDQYCHLHLSTCEILWGKSQGLLARLVSTHVWVFCSDIQHVSETPGILVI